MKTIYIDKYGNLTTEDKSEYKLVLTGSYRWSQFYNMYEHFVDLSKSTIPLSCYYNKNLLVNL